jgi:hypothetical protein
VFLTAVSLETRRKDSSFLRHIAGCIALSTIRRGFEPAAFYGKIV